MFTSKIEHFLEKGLADAIKKKEHDAGAALIEAIQSMPRGHSLLKKDEGDKSFLFLALENGCRKIADQLLAIHRQNNEEAIIFDKDSIGRSCLHLAAGCDLEILKGLIQICEKNAKQDMIFSQDDEGRSILHHALTVTAPPTDRIQYLLQVIAEKNDKARAKEIVNYTDHAGKTALHYALDRKLQDAAIALINHQADLHLIDNQGESTFDLSLKLTQAGQVSLFTKLNPELQLILLKHYRKMLLKEPDEAKKSAYFLFCQQYNLKSLILAQLEFNSKFPGQEVSDSDMRNLFPNTPNFNPKQSLITSSHSSKNEARQVLSNLIKLIDEHLTSFPSRKYFSTNKKALFISGNILFWLTYFSVLGYLISQTSSTPRTIQVNVTNCPPDPEICPTVRERNPAYMTASTLMVCFIIIPLVLGALADAVIWSEMQIRRPAEVSEKDFKELIGALENTLLGNLKKQDLKGQAFQQAQSQNIIDLEADIASLKKTPSVDTAIPILNQLKNTLESIRKDINKFAELPSFSADQEEENAPDQTQIYLSSIGQNASPLLPSNYDSDHDSEEKDVLVSKRVFSRNYSTFFEDRGGNDNQSLLANNEESSSEETNDYIV